MSETNPIQLRDEVLQLLFWFEGEGFRSEATLGGLGRFLNRPSSELESVLADLVELGWVARRDGEGGPDYRLTEAGRSEGGRRFADEFAGLTGQAHGECSDPDCDCHTDPEAALECQARRHAAGHGV